MVLEALQPLVIQNYFIDRNILLVFAHWLHSIGNFVAGYNAEVKSNPSFMDRRSLPSQAAPTVSQSHPVVPAARTRVYKAIADEVLSHVNEQIRCGVISMSDVAKSEFTSIVAGNFYEQQRRKSATGTVVLSDETFVELERHVAEQVELRRQYSEL